MKEKNSREITVVPHNPKWSLAYQEEIQEIAPLIGDNLIALHHIGSTSIPDLPAKPVIDILLVVKNLNSLDAATPLLEKLGYHAMGEYGIPGRRYFWKDNHAVHLHGYEEGNPEIPKYLDFKNYLTAHPEEAKNYGKLKAQIAEKHSRDSHAYCQSKKGIVTEILDKARIWQEKGPTPATTYPMPQVGRDVCFLKNVVKNPNIIVGDFTYYHDYQGAQHFEKNNVVYHEDIIGDKLVIGKFCQIAMGARFIMNASMHSMSGFSTYPFAIFSENWAKKYPVDFPVRGDTLIGHDVWIGYQACFMPGVKVGDGAIIAAHSVVTKDIPPYSIVGGNPAAVIRQRYPDDVIETLQGIAWWDWPIEIILANLRTITGAEISNMKKIQQSFP